MNEGEPEQPGFDATELTHIDASLPVEPTRIGPYRVLQKLGEGGMGVVYEAEQERPVRRKVALKVIKLGMDTAQVVTRFESERQALALMNHPCIAGVFDAGSTADGRPYFAMECVRGVPITTYCQRRALDTRARLELFIRVCEGVQHAHQKGIIHRDIKPSNVLVRDEDGRHVPKIIDFGIAKATAQRLTEKTLFTETGQLIGTPEYMSPEQAEMSGLDIDTRTDVYQLGVLLYELLTGRLPLGADALRRIGFNEFRRRVLEDEPVRPSTRVTRPDDGEPIAPASAPDAPKALARALRGDLDWVTMKALEKDRTRRYAAASELAADVGRYLRHEPVLAFPPSNLYRLRKFVRRHHTGVAFGVVLFVLLASFAVTMAVQRAQIARARDRATAAAATASQVSGFLSELFKASEPSEARGREISAREILDRGADRIEKELADSPTVQARLMSIMGDVYTSHGLRDQARGLLEHALDVQLKHGDDELETARTMERLAFLLVQSGELERAIDYYRQALEMRRTRLGEEDPLVADSMNTLANALGAHGDREAARPLHERAFGIWERRLAPDDPALATILHNRAALQLMPSGDLEGARPLLERALAIRRRALGPDHPKVAYTLTALGRLFEAMGDYAEARVRYDEALALNEKVYKPPHAKIADSLIRLAVLGLRQGDHASAESYYRRAIETYRATESLDVPFVAYDLACYAALAGDRTEALRLLRRAVLELGFSDDECLARESAFASLRGDPEFEAVLAAREQR